MEARREVRTGTALLVVIPATLCAVVATTVGLARSNPGDVLPAFVTLAGVAVVVALDFIALVNLQGRTRPRRQAQAPAAPARAARVARAERVERHPPRVASVSRRAVAPVPVKPDALALGAQDDYVDSLLSDLAG